MKYYILTNNSEAVKELEESHPIHFVEGGLMDVLIQARDLINKGDVLLNHPLYGSVKPNETPYRSLLLKPSKAERNDGIAAVDADSVRLIGNAVITAAKFTAKKETTDPQLLKDFQEVDLSLLLSAVSSADM